VTYLVLDTTSLHLVWEHLRAWFLSLGFVDVLHQYTLVLEDITLGFLVEDVVASYHKKIETTFEKWWETDTYRCLSILPASRYFRNNLLKTLCLLIHRTLVGILASEVPFLLPGPVWRPFRFAARRSRVRAREWTVVGLMIIRPSFISFLTWVRELAFPISACSAGSSQILRWPTLATLAARRFCDRRFTMGTI